MPLKQLPKALRAILARTDAPAPEAKYVPGTLEIRAAGGSDHELLIYGNIGESWWEETVSAKSVVDQLAGVKSGSLLVRINSYGGSVTDGIAIYNALRRCSADGVTVDVQIDGIAASIASLIAMAGDTVTMPDNALMMLHAPWGFAYGNSAELRDYAEVLDTYGKAMATSYARKTGKNASEFETMWATGKDNWYTAAEAVEAGLADKAISAEQPDEDAEAADANAAALQRLLARAPQQIAAQVRGLLHPSDSSPPVATVRRVARSLSPADASPLASASTPLEITMPQSNPTPADDVTAASRQAAADAVAAIRDRNVDIKAMASPHFGNLAVRAYYDDVIANADPSVTAGDVGAKILAILAKEDDTPTAGTARVVAGADDRDKQRHAMAIAIDSRTGFAQSEGDNPYRGFTMFEMARACAERAGVNTRGMDRMDIVASAFTHSTSDFPLLMGDVAHKSLKRGYEESAEVFPLFTRAVTLTDFKPTTLAGLGRFSNLDVVREGAEYKYGTFNESGSALRLVTYGKMFSVTRQAVINDDLNALSDVPRKMGQAAKRTLGNAVFGILTANPVMGDGKELFHADHGNLVTPGTVITTTSVDGLRVLMALQKDADGSVIHVPLKYLVVPVGLGGLARTVLASEFEVSGARNNTTPNIVRNSFEIIEDPRLDAADPKAWYGVADPAMFDGIAVGYLDGKQEPYLESKQGWNVDGTEWKVRLDAAAAAVDHMALAKNPGA